MTSSSLKLEEPITLTERGLYCAAGGFYIDPLEPVDLAILTHAHADHARHGSNRYIASKQSERILRLRLGEDIDLQTLEYAQQIRVGDALVSLHPAGHVLGSAQVRVEANGRVWVISGDYKRDLDPTCTPFEPVQCDVFVTEATFALPVYHWQPTVTVAQDLLRWWQSAPERPSLVFGYAFGKAQRLLAEIGRLTDQPVYVHGSIERLNEAYRLEGIALAKTIPVAEQPKGFDWRGQLVMAPPSAHRSAWMKKFKEPQTAFASGWMAVRGNRRRRGYERGFVLSDHADWAGLIKTILETDASRVLVTHGQSDVLARYLQEKHGILAEPLGNLYEGEASGDTI
jgi:putative mRNA 3-end processing factor